MAAHSSVLVWRIPGTGEPGGLLSMGLHRVGHDLSDLAAAAFSSNHGDQSLSTWFSHLGVILMYGHSRCVGLTSQRCVLVVVVLI